MGFNVFITVSVFLVLYTVSPGVRGPLLLEGGVESCSMGRVVFDLPLIINPVLQALLRK